MRDDGFPKLTGTNLRRGSVPSVPDPIASVGDDCHVTNANPKPLTWTASAESIRETVRRGRVAPNQSTKTETHHS